MNLSIPVLALCYLISEASCSFTLSCDTNKSDVAIAFRKDTYLFFPKIADIRTCGRSNMFGNFFEREGYRRCIAALNLPASYENAISMLFGSSFYSESDFRNAMRLAGTSACTHHSLKLGGFTDLNKGRITLSGGEIGHTDYPISPSIQNNYPIRPTSSHFDNFAQNHENIPAMTNEADYPSIPSAPPMFYLPIIIVMVFAVIIFTCIGIYACYKHRQNSEYKDETVITYMGDQDQTQEAQPSENQSYQAQTQTYQPQSPQYHSQAYQTQSPQYQPYQPQSFGHMNDSFTQTEPPQYQDVYPEIVVNPLAYSSDKKPSF